MNSRMETGMDIPTRVGIIGSGGRALPRLSSSGAQWWGGRNEWAERTSDEEAHAKGRWQGTASDLLKFVLERARGGAANTQHKA